MVDTSALTGESLPRKCGLGSDVAIEAADIVIMTDEPYKIATAMNISKRTLKIVKQNIIFALGVKLIVLILGASGTATMLEAIFADVGVSVIAILNAMRALKCREYRLIVGMISRNRLHH